MSGFFNSLKSIASGAANAAGGAKYQDDDDDEGDAWNFMFMIEFIWRFLFCIFITDFDGIIEEFIGFVDELLLILFWMWWGEWLTLEIFFLCYGNGTFYYCVFFFMCFWVIWKKDEEEIQWKRNIMVLLWMCILSCDVNGNKRERMKWI